MSFKRMVKGSNKKNESAEVYQRLEALESQTKRMNTLDVYIKKVLEMEKRLSQAIDKNESGPERKKISKSEPTTQELGKKLLPLFEEKIHAEFAPIQDTIEGLYKRMSKVENKIFALEKWITEAVAAVKSGIDEKGNGDHDPQVIFQEIRVDTLFVDKYEQLNNIGNLGVKDLSGQMNIGVTIENSSNPSEEVSNETKEKWKGKMKKFKEMKEKYGINNNNDKDQNESSRNEEVNASASDLNQSNKT